MAAAHRTTNNHAVSLDREPGPHNHGTVDDSVQLMTPKTA